MEFAHSTFIQKDQNNRHQLCGGATLQNRVVLFENVISAPLQAFDAFASPNPSNCTFLGTILSRQATPPPGTIVADPEFVDVAGGDFHLSPSSPGIDAAVAGTISSDHDLDGAPRPQGAAADIGAYELAQ